MSSAFQACIRLLPRLPPILRVVLTFCAGMIAAFYFYSGSSPSSNTNLRPRIKHHASHMHPLSLTLGCHHHQISARPVGCGFAGHHRVWLSAAAEQQQRVLRASVRQRPLCDKARQNKCSARATNSTGSALQQQAQQQPASSDRPLSRKNCSKR